jgi:hypothetical protein
VSNSSAPRIEIGNRIINQTGHEDTSHSSTGAEDIVNNHYKSLTLESAEGGRRKLEMKECLF